MGTVLSVIIGGVAGMLKFIIGKHLDAKHQQQMALMQSAGILTRNRELAASIKDEGISYTRRILALIFAAALTAPVFHGLFFPDATITVPQSYLSKGIWDWILPWKEGKEMTKYITIKAPVLAMPIYDICAIIIGFYFGSGGSKAR